MTPEDCERIPCPSPRLCGGREYATCPQCIELLCGIGTKPKANPYPTPEEMKAIIASGDAALLAFAGKH